VWDAVLIIDRRKKLQVAPFAWATFRPRFSALLLGFGRLMVTFQPEPFAVELRIG
jgi:hypothetical protein